MLRYVKLAIKQPKLIIDFFYKKHLGIILACDIDEYNNNPIKPISEKEIQIKRSTDAYKIVSYYNGAGRSAITIEKTTEWLEKGNQCLFVYPEGRVIGGTWIFFSEVKIPQLSGRVLSEKHNIIFNQNVCYQAYVLIKSDYRGMGVYNLLND